jgi:NitT/TauT family transport system ATP-binding protein
MPETPAIAFRAVGKVFPDGYRALSNVNLDIGRGEFVSIIGPSGCGKTTLLKLTDGLLYPDEGEALVNGTPVTSPGLDRAVVFQSFALLPWATVVENVAFGLRLRGVRKTEAQRLALPFIEMVGLTQFRDKFPRELSGGMQQRVGLARALAVQPEIMLMDEPFGSLDAQTRNLLQSDLERIWETQGQTVLFVTHAMDEAVFLSDRVVVMGTHPGTIEEVITVDLPRPRTDDTRTDPAFVALTAQIWETLRGIILADSERQRATLSAGS